VMGARGLGRVLVAWPLGHGELAIPAFINLRPRILYNPIEMGIGPVGSGIAVERDAARATLGATFPAHPHRVGGAFQVAYIRYDELPEIGIAAVGGYLHLYLHVRLARVHRLRRDGHALGIIA
jgi:hypothetical protein